MQPRTLPTKPLPPLLAARIQDLKGETEADKKRFDRVRRAERHYAVQLRKVARHVGDIIAGFPIGDPTVLSAMQTALNKYADLIEPWARAVSASMLADVSRRDEKIWGELAKGMGRALRQEILTAPTGAALRALLDEQVKLITSLPRDAGLRVHKLTIEARIDSGRAAAIAKEIQRSGQVTASRATLIARTEVARTASGLTMARATHVGSEGYVWRTALDGRVRKLHKKHEGKYFRWDSPPIAGSNGERAHAGMIYNCRCFPEVVFPNRIT